MTGPFYLRRLLTLFSWLSEFHKDYSNLSPDKIEDTVLILNAEPPRIEDLMEFARFYIAQSTGRISTNGLATRDTVKTNLEFLFAGIERRIGTVIESDIRTRVYNVCL